MFGELLESRARRARNRAGMIASVIGHGAFIALAVAATRTPLTARVPNERIDPLPVLLPDPQPQLPGRSTRVHAPGQPIVAPPPLTVPDVVVPLEAQVDLGLPIPPDDPWSGGAAPDAGRGSPATTSGTGDGIPFAAGVDKPAMALGGNPAPHYPEILRRNGVRGEVTIEVVVDTTGAAQMESLRIIASDHPLLSDAVRTALKRARFLPAETAGRKVRMWVRQSFVFEVRER